MLDENSDRTFEKLVEALNVGKIWLFLIVYTQKEIFKKMANGFHMNCLNWLFKIV